MWEESCLLKSHQKLPKILQELTRESSKICEISVLRTIMPFAAAHLEIFHCTHHPMIPKSDLYFTFRSTLNA